jgi:hypothetical protein
MQLAGIEAIVGSPNFHDRVTDGVRSWQKQENLGTMPEEST